MSFTESCDVTLTFPGIYYKSHAWDVRKKEIDYKQQIEIAMMRTMNAIAQKL